MGVNHLRRDAGKAASGAFRGNVHKSPQSGQTSSGDHFKPYTQADGGGTHVPKVGAVQGFDSRSVRPGNTTTQPPKGNQNGGRAGSKSSQEKLGMRSGNDAPMSAGKMFQVIPSEC